MSSQNNTEADAREFYMSEYTPEQEREDALNYEAFGPRNELEGHYRNCEAGYFAQPDASQCGCGGSGYYLSQLDTWHKCPTHFVPGQAHPEDENREYEAEAAPEPTAPTTEPAPPPDFDESNIPF